MGKKKNVMHKTGEFYLPFKNFLLQSACEMLTDTARFHLVKCPFFGLELQAQGHVQHICIFDTSFYALLLQFTHRKKSLQGPPFCQEVNLVYFYHFPNTHVIFLAAN